VHGELPPPLTSTRGLGIVDFLVRPHADSRVERYERMVGEYVDHLRLIPLRDDQALIVAGDSYRIVPS